MSYSDLERNLDRFADQEADLAEPTLVYGERQCPRPCSECADGKHHWLGQAIDPDDEDEVADFRAEHPGFLAAGFRPDHPAFERAEEFLLAYFACKHCPALAEGDSDV